MPLNFQLKSARWMVALAAAAGALMSASHDANARGLAVFISGNSSSCVAPSGNPWNGFAGDFAFQRTAFTQGNTAFVAASPTPVSWYMGITDVGSNFSYVPGPGSAGHVAKKSDLLNWGNHSSLSYSYTSSSGVSCTVTASGWSYN